MIAPQLSQFTLALVVWYLAMSVIAFITYAIDKSRARKTRQQRIPEINLHLLALLGGWPGAGLAQQRLRHKTVKPSFRREFWATVVINLAALGSGIGYVLRES